MATNTEVAIGDDELDGLMAELEAETANLVAAPTVAAAPTPAPAAGAPKEESEADALLRMKEAARKKREAAEAAAAGTPAPAPEPLDDLAALEAELEEKPAPAPAPVAAPAPAADIEPYDPPTSDLEAEMAALEAELQGAAPNVVTEAVKALTPADPAPQTDDMAALEAELAVDTAVPEKKATTVSPALAEKIAALADDAPFEPEPAPAPAPVAAPAPAPAPAAEPAPAKKGLEFFIDPAKFRDDTRVSETNLDDCMMQQAGMLSDYVAKHAYAEAQASRIELQVKIAEGKLYDKHRKALLATGEKVTEKMVETAVTQDPQYAAIHVRLIEARSIAAINKGFVESLKQRRDMIIQLGSDRRADGAGAARIIAAQANANDSRARALAVGQQARHPGQG
jgi:hypothetical protein